MFNYDIIAPYDQLWLGYVKLLLLSRLKLAPREVTQKSVRMSSHFKIAITLRNFKQIT